MQQFIENVKDEFESRFDKEYVVVRSPGRVNLIGGHTDYNDGFVLPLAIDKSIVMAMSANAGREIQCYSVDKDEYFETELSEDLQKSGKGWPDYLLGIADRLQTRGYQIEGFDCVFGGDIPIGAGLSSSAALESGVLFGINHLFDLGISPTGMAKIAQEAENDFVGVQCGIMDQFISLNGRENKAMKLDCRSLDYEFYPFDNDEIAVVLCDTQKRRELASSGYNIRRRQCEEGVRALQKFNFGIQSLRDVSSYFLEKHRQDLDPVIYKRCKYIIEENDRVLQACEDLENGDWERFGNHLFDAHLGLCDEFEATTKELDVLVEKACHIEGVYGARMMGGGFGGCTINVVDTLSFDAFCNEIQTKYTKETGGQIKIYKTKASEGTHLM